MSPSLLAERNEYYVKKNNDIDSKNEYLKNGLNFIMDSVETARNDKVKEIEEKGYNDGIQLGIFNTIFALYSANMKDEDIIQITREVWKIEENEIEDILVETKQNFILRKLRRYLKLQGENEKSIRNFFDKNKIQLNLDKKLLFIFYSR